MQEIRLINEEAIDKEKKYFNIAKERIADD